MKTVFPPITNYNVALMKRRGMWDELVGIYPWLNKFQAPILRVIDGSEMQNVLNELIKRNENQKEKDVAG